jgi:GntR family transcriptional regulator
MATSLDSVIVVSFCVLDMSVQVKHQRVASRLSRDIARGVLAPGARLPGEHELAARFDVSRGTVRQALAALQRDGLIEKHAGAGSFVTFDGHPLDERLGWSRALASHGVRTVTVVLRLGPVRAPTLARRLGLDADRFLAVDRLRRLPSGRPISLERSRVPWRAAFATLTRDGLPGGSLSRAMAGAGLHASGGCETVELVRLRGGDADLLEVPAGTPFLRCERTAYDPAGRPVEQVTSWLDPRHVRLRLSFGSAP